jgi:hypothetical protein
LLLISGASGAGKTSVREAVAGDLAPGVEAVELRHLEPVPAVPDVAWRQRMAERAVARSRVLDVQGRHLLLAGDPVAPGEVWAAPSATSVDIAVCLLDVAEDTQRERLRRRGDPEELLPHHMVAPPRQKPRAHASRRDDARMGGDGLVEAGHVAVADHGHRRFGDERGRSG